MFPVIAAVAPAAMTYGRGRSLCAEGRNVDCRIIL